MSSLWLFLYLFRLIWEWLKRPFKGRAVACCGEEAFHRRLTPTKVVSTQTGVKFNSAELTHLQLLSSSLVAFVKNDLLTDITLVCENEEFRAHRIILSAVSPYFQTKFERIQSERVELPEISAKCMTNILSFIYTGHVVNASSSNKAVIDMILAHPENVTNDTISYKDTLKVCHTHSEFQVQDSITTLQALDSDENMFHMDTYNTDYIMRDLSSNTRAIKRFITPKISKTNTASEEKTVTTVYKSTTVSTREQHTEAVKKPYIIINDSSFVQMSTRDNEYVNAAFSYSNLDNMNRSNNGYLSTSDLYNYVSPRNKLKFVTGQSIATAQLLVSSDSTTENYDKIDNHLNIVSDFSCSRNVLADKDPLNSKDYFFSPPVNETTLHKQSKITREKTSHSTKSNSPPMNVYSEETNFVNTLEDAITQGKCITSRKEAVNLPSYPSDSVEKHFSNGNTPKPSHPYMKYIIATDDMKILLDLSHYKINRNSAVNGKLEILLEESDFLKIYDFIYRFLEDHYITMSCFKAVFDFIAQLNNPYALSKIVGFLAENFKDVSKTSDFALLNEGQLKKIIQHSNINKLFKEDILIGILRWMVYDSKREVLLDDFLTILNLQTCSACLNDVINDIVTSKINCSRNDSLNVGLLVARMISMNMNNEKSKNEQKLCFFDYNKELKHIATVVYDGEENRQLTIKELPGPVYHGGLTVIAYGYHIYYFGISAGTKSKVTSTEIITYCLITNCIEALEKALVYPVSYAGVGILNDAFFIVNGLGKHYGIAKTVQRYNPMYRTCLPVASTNNGHISPCVLPFKGSLYIVGSCGATDNFLEHYNVVNDQWTTLTQVPGYMVGCYAALCKRKVFVLGKRSGTRFQVYDLVLDNWDFMEVNSGPTEVSGLWSIKRNGETVLVVRGNQSIYSYTV